MNQPTISPPLDVDRLQELLWSFGTHRVITVAARTGLLSRLADAPATPEAVAAELALDARAVGKLARALCAIGLLEPVGDGAFGVVPALAAHLRGGPRSLIPFLAHSHLLYDRWGEGLEPWVRGAEWPMGTRASTDPRGFGAAMQAMGHHVAAQVAAQLDVSAARNLLDVGGSFGHYARALLRRAPALQAVVLDRPEVVELGRTELAAGPDADLATRLTFRSGDYLESDLGGPYDLVLQANILHQESAASAARLVARGAAAVAPGGCLAIVDFAIDDAQQQHLLGALFAINMRSFGDTYPEPTIRDWMARAGLSGISRIDLSSFRWLIIGHRR